MPGRERLYPSIGLWAVLIGAVAVLLGGFIFDERFPLAAPWLPVARSNLLGYAGIAVLISALIYWLCREWMVQAAALALFVVGLAVSDLASIATLMLYVFSATITGLALLARKDDLRGLDVCVAMSIGSACFVIIYNAIVHLPLNYPAVHLALFLLPLLVLRSYTRQLFGVLSSAFLRPCEVTFLQYLTGAFIFWSLLAYLIVAALPEVYHDPLAVYLYMASRLKSAAIWNVGPEFLVTSVMPLGLVWTQAILNMLGGEAAAKLSNVIMLSNTAAMIYFASRDRAGREAALLLSALLISAPVMFLQSVTLFYDNGIAMLVACAFLLVTHYGRVADNPRAIFICAFVLGAAAASKGTVLLIVPFFWAYFACEGLRRDGLRGLLWPFLAGLIFLAVAGFPYVWSWLTTGNPVFPFKNALFRSPLFPAVDFATIYSRPLSWTLLYDLTFNTSEYLEGSAGAFGFAALFLLPQMAITAIFVRSSPLWFGLFLILGGGMALSLEQQYIRYYTLLLPVLFFCAGTWMGDAIVVAGRQYAKLQLGACAIIAVLGLYYIPSSGWAWRTFPIDMAWTDAGRRAWVRQMVPQRNLIEAVEKTHGASARVLFVGKMVSANFSGIPLMYTWYNSKLLAEINAVTQEGEFGKVLARHGVTHILITPSDKKATPNIDLISRYAKRYLHLVASMGGADLWFVPGGSVAEAVSVGDESWPEAGNLVRNDRFEHGLSGWGVNGSPVQISETSSAVRVNVANSLAQAIPVAGGKPYRLMLRVACDTGGMFRLQINWLSSRRKAEATPDITIASCGPHARTYQKLFQAPESADTAALFVISANDKFVDVSRVGLFNAE